MRVVATAGHVDHGKSTLVRALTQMHPDRLAEEQRRGMSIELGYAWTDLDGVGEVAFVDVPGHERFLATALAGVGPVQIALLVVAADDPWMPQAAEHLSILNLLGVHDGVVAVTRSDLTPAGPAIERTREQLAGTSLEKAPIIAVSAATGDGLSELREALVAVLSAAPQSDPAADVRLWVDRRFHVQGAGTVVTGTLPAGTIRRGDVLTDVEGNLVRVRDLEALGRRRDQVSGTARVALNISGEVDAIGRGSTLLTPDRYAPTTIVDVAVDGPERLPQHLQLHVGSAKVDTRVRPLTGPYARLTLAEYVPLRVGDRAVLRDPGSRHLWGVRVMDPAPPPLHRRGAAGVRAQDLATLDGSLAADLKVRGPARRSLLRRIGLNGPVTEDLLEVDGWLVPDVERRRAELVALAEGGNGLSLTEATRSLDLPDPAITAALVAPPLAYRGGRIRSAAHLPSERAIAAAGWLRSALADSPFAAPTADGLRAAGIDATLAGELHAEGLALRLAPGVLLLPDAPDLAVGVLAELPQPFTTSAARVALATSRRVVLPLLALLDGSGRTARLADDTRRVIRLPSSRQESHEKGP